MPSRRPFIQHTFEGGWATAFGPTVLVSGPDEQGVVRIPYLLDAEDALFELNGGIRKAPGTSKVNSSALESGAAINGIYDFWLGSGSGSEAQHRVIHIGTKIYKDDGDGSFTQIASGLTSGAVPSYATFDDFLIISSDASADVPKSWDGTTFQNLAGSPPNFAFSVKHKNWHFAAGVAASGSRLFYSAQLDPEDWTSGTSGNIDIDPNDGDHITGLISHKNELWVFKGPHKGSIHRITGTSNSDWARTTFIEGVGAVWHNSIFRIQDDVGFLWSDGSVRTLSATEKFGDFREASLTFEIQPWLDDNLSIASLKKVWAITGPAGRRIYLSIPRSGSTTNNGILSFDTQFRPGRWTFLPSFTAPAMALVLDSDVSTIFLGGSDGFVRSWDNSTRSIDGTTGLSYKVKTPHIDYGVPERMKTLAGASLAIQPHNNGNITFSWTRDIQTEQSVTISQGGVDVLGSADANEFTLGTSRLGGSRFVNRFSALGEEGGEFRSVSYQFTNSANNEDVEIHSFGAFVEQGAESMENE